MAGILHSLELGRIRLSTDLGIALEGAFTGGAGILLIAGTGSVCFGKSSAGKIHRSGGWGWLADEIIEPKAIPLDGAVALARKIQQ